MGKVWNGLVGAGIEAALEPGSYMYYHAMAVNIFVKPDGTFSMPMALMTGKQIHVEAREMCNDVEIYRAINIETLRESEAITDGQLQSQLKCIYDIGQLSEPAVLVNIPKFIRLCLELLDRGYNLEDMLYDAPC